MSATPSSSAWTRSWVEAHLPDTTANGEDDQRGARARRCERPPVAERGRPQGSARGQPSLVTPHPPLERLSMKWPPNFRRASTSHSAPPELTSGALESKEVRRCPASWLPPNR